MYGKLKPLAYFELSKEQRELLTILLVFADADGLADMAGVAIQAHTGLSKDAYEEAKEFILNTDISRLCTADKLKFVPMYTTGRFVFVWNSKRLSQSEWAKLREFVFGRDDYTCQYCGIRGKSLECDHVVPVSRGGSNDTQNLVTACKTCNQSKRAKLVSEWLPDRASANG